MRIFLAASDTYKHIAWSLQKGLSAKGHEISLYFTEKAEPLIPEATEILVLLAPVLAFNQSYQPKDNTRRIIEAALARKMPIIPLVFFNNHFGLAHYKRFIHESVQGIRQFGPISLDFENWPETIKRITVRLQASRFSSGNFALSPLPEIDEAALRKGREAEEAYERGVESYLGQDYQKAKIYFDKAIGLLPDYVDAYSNRALVRNRLEGAEAAIEDMSEAVRIKPDNIYVYTNRSMFYYQLKQYEAARDDATKAIELNPELAVAYNQRANAYKELGEKEKALEDYNKAIELEANVSTSYLNRARLQEELEHKAEAIADYSRAIELDSNNGAAYHARAKLYVQGKEVDAALADFEKAIGLTKSEKILAELHYERAALYTELRDFDNAKPDIKAGMALRPKLDRDKGLQYIQDMMALAEQDDRYKTRIDPIIPGQDELYDSVAKYLKPKFDAEGFTISRYNYTAGGSVIGFSSEAYWFLISYEKGQVFAELGTSSNPPGNNLYFDLWYVFEFLKHDFLRNYAGTIEEQVRHIAHNLLKYWDEIFTDDLLIRREPELKRFIDEGQRKIWGNR